jgi:tetratricopeptide (TPR) repeat protein
LVAAAEKWLEQVRSAARRGELLTAVDLAEQGLSEHPDELWLKHASVLALARAGATDEAAERFHGYGLASRHEEDVAALGARIAKDLALAADDGERSEKAGAARDRYQSIFERTGGYYPAVNAATLSLLAGEPERARELAHMVLDLVGSGGGGDHSYYAAATAGEAHLLLGDETAAREALERAMSLHGGDHAALATTRRQLRLICDLTGADAELVTVLAGPSVAHFCGHRIAAGGRFPPEAELEVARRIEAEVDRDPPGYAYGALASGADILWAEALTARGAELHVVLPFSSDEFVEASVAAAGRSWVERFGRCMAAAASVTYATDDAYLEDAVLFRYGTEIAMGLALLRAGYLDASVRQLAVWDGAPALGRAGTAIDVDTWRRTGRPACVIAPPGDAAPPAPPPDEGSEPGRVVRAMLFADVKGFSRLTDEQAASFAEHVLGSFARVLDRHGEAVEHRNTWGDALYVVLDSARAAAECALDLQEAMAALDLEAAGLPGDLALRLGAHVGPVFPVHDPVIGALAFMGSHVSRTARVEPVTPPGTVYVTEPFAAVLALEPDDDLDCDYVGHNPAAKDYGRLRMYRLQRRGS